MNVLFRFDAPLVSRQLRDLGVLEAIRIRSEGYPQRHQFENILNRFNCLIPDAIRLELRQDSKDGGQEPSEDIHVQAKLTYSPRSLVRTLLTSYSNTDDSFRIGNTKAFMKNFTFEDLEKRKSSKCEEYATQIQCTYRRYRAEKTYRNLRNSAGLLSGSIRLYLRVKRRRDAAGVIQAGLRAWHCQCHWREWKLRVQASIAIQASFRVIFECRRVKEHKAAEAAVAAAAATAAATAVAAAAADVAAETTASNVAPSQKDSVEDEAVTGDGAEEIDMLSKVEPEELRKALYSLRRGMDMASACNVIGNLVNSEDLDIKNRTFASLCDVGGVELIITALLERPMDQPTRSSVSNALYQVIRQSGKPSAQEIAGWPNRIASAIACSSMLYELVSRLLSPIEAPDEELEAGLGTGLEILKRLAYFANAKTFAAAGGVKALERVLYRCCSAASGTNEAVLKICLQAIQCLDIIASMSVSGATTIAQNRETMKSITVCLYCMPLQTEITAAASRLLVSLLYPGYNRETTHKHYEKSNNEVGDTIKNPQSTMRGPDEYIAVHGHGYGYGHGNGHGYVYAISRAILRAGSVEAVVQASMLAPHNSNLFHYATLLLSHPAVLSVNETIAVIEDLTVSPMVMAVTALQRHGHGKGDDDEDDNHEDDNDDDCGTSLAHEHEQCHDAVHLTLALLQSYPASVTQFTNANGVDALIVNAQMNLSIGTSDHDAKLVHRFCRVLRKLSNARVWGTKGSEVLVIAIQLLQKFLEHEEIILSVLQIVVELQKEVQSLRGNLHGQLIQSLAIIASEHCYHHDIISTSAKICEMVCGKHENRPDVVVNALSIVRQVGHDKRRESITLLNLASLSPKYEYLMVDQGVIGMLSRCCQNIVEIESAFRCVSRLLVRNRSARIQYSQLDVIDIISSAVKAISNESPQEITKTSSKADALTRIKALSGIVDLIKAIVYADVCGKDVEAQLAEIALKLCPESEMHDEHVVHAFTRLVVLLVKKQRVFTQLMKVHKTSSVLLEALALHKRCKATIGIIIDAIGYASMLPDIWSDALTVNAMRNLAMVARGK